MISSSLPRQVDGPEQCQQVCADTKGCAHFSYWKLSKHCHLQDAFAVRRTVRIGFVSGPFRCWSDAPQDKFIKIDNYTILPTELGCTEIGVLYSPSMGAAKLLDGIRETRAGSLEAISICRRQCAEAVGCSHWSLDVFNKLCRLSGKRAISLNIAGVVSGKPQACAITQDFVIRRDDERRSAATIVASRANLRNASVSLLSSVPIEGMVCVFAALALVGGAIAIRRKGLSERVRRAPLPVYSMVDDLPVSAN